MSRFKLHIEYEGHGTAGAVQKNARTVRGAHRGRKGVFGTTEMEIYGSGRTDAGVHALVQVAHLDVKTMLGPEIIRMKLNDLLPADINVLEVEKAAATFHARHDAVARRYLYQISRRRTAFGKRYVWWIKDRLDLPKMEETAKIFVGMKDFRSFTADDPDEKSTKVHIGKITLKEEGDLILIRVEGSHFLWKPVRQIVGIMAEVGRKSYPEGNRIIFFRPIRKPAKYTAPPPACF
jgi:tRNA pseudouridine38-40 synthase